MLLPGDQEAKTTPRDRPQDLSAWLEEFTENLVDAKSTSSENDRADLSEPFRPAPLPTGRQIGNTTHLRTSDCEICKRTENTRALCRRRINSGILRATNFGDTLTADQQILNEEEEPRNNHRYAIVVQDFGTQWIQSFSWKTKTSQETNEELTEVSRSEIQSKG